MLIYLSTFLLAFSVLLFEVSLTRIFSVTSWHHFTHMIISISLLGFGAAGTYLTLRRDLEISLRWISRVVLGYAVASVASFLLITRIHFAPLIITKDPSQLLSLLLYDIGVAVPFFFAGLGLSALITRFRTDIHRVYFSDLFGASLGALASVLFITVLGAVGTIFLVSVVGGLSSLVLAHAAADGQGKRPQMITTAILAAVLVSVVAFKPYLVHVPPSKDLHVAVNPGKPERPDSSRWHVVARVDVSKPAKLPLSGYGGNLSRRVPFTMWTQRVLFQDGAAPTGILRIAKGEPLSKLRFLGEYLQAAPYALVEKPRALVIGVGGGIDVLVALYHQAKHVTGVEVNPLMLDAIQTQYPDFTNHVFERPDVELVAAEGRHFLSRSRKSYDVIQLSGVDTYTALSSGAYALAENYLYTVEALATMWGRLSPKGVVSFSRWFLSPPRETLRVATTMAEMLRRQGVKEPVKHIAVLRGHSWAETLLSKEPFTEARMETLRAWAKVRGFAVVFDPFRPAKSQFETALRGSAAQREAFYRAYQYDVRPTSDDSPFFFDFYKLGRIFEQNEITLGFVTNTIPIGLVTLVVGLVQILLLALIGIIVPLRRVGMARASGRLATILYFGALGLGFMFIEIALIQKLMVLLGGPAYSLSLTLFVILLFSGLGSFWARSRQAWLEARFLWLGATIAVLAPSVGFLLDALMPWLLSLGFVARATVAVMIVGPLAFLLGMPFPLGIHVLGRLSAGWVPWAWAINSFMTVLGPLLCIFIGMQLGFRSVLAVGGVVYVLGFAFFLRLLRSSLSAGQVALE